MHNNYYIGTFFYESYMIDILTNIMTVFKFYVIKI